MIQWRAMSSRRVIHTPFWAAMTRPAAADVPASVSDGSLTARRELLQDVLGVPPPYPVLMSNRAYYYFALAFAVFAVGLCAGLLTCEYGRAIDAIREGERLAECSGVPVIRFKVTAFVIACALAGMQGSLQAHYIRYVGPESYSIVQSLNLVVMNVIGGMSSLSGALIGTVFMVTLPELLRGYVNLQQIMFGAILFATMAFLPGGLIELFRRLLARLRAARTGIAT